MSRLIEWSEKYATNIPEIDKQHRQLFLVIHELHMMAAHPLSTRDGLTEVFERLAKYIADHFAYEEELMAKAEYDGLEAHKKQHHLFEEKIKRVRVDIENAVYDEDVRLHLKSLTDYLVDWWGNHIARVDQSYVPTVSGASLPD